LVVRTLGIGNRKGGKKWRILRKIRRAIRGAEVAISHKGKADEYLNHHGWESAIHVAESRNYTERAGDSPF
jgi:hypothetical protein